MGSFEETQLLVLRSHGWSTGLCYYDFLQSIRFGPDDRGVMKQGGGQSMKIEARFLYSLPEPNQLHLEFLDTPAWYDPEELGFESTEENAHRLVVFDLIPGPHEVPFGTMGGLVKRRYAWLLSFQTEPFPEGYEPGVTLLRYHGGFLRPDE